MAVITMSLKLCPLFTCIINQIKGDGALLYNCGCHLNFFHLFCVCLFVLRWVFAGRRILILEKKVTSLAMEKLGLNILLII